MNCLNKSVKKKTMTVGSSCRKAIKIVGKRVSFIKTIKTDYEM